MKQKIIDKEQIALVGMVFYGDPFKEKGGWSQENEIGKLWKRFMAKEKQVKNRIGKGAFEVHIGTEE